MPVDTPPSSNVAQIANRRLGYVVEGAVSSAERHIDSGIAKADYIRASDSTQVSEKPWMSIHPPTSGDIAEVLDHRLGRVIECAVSSAERHIDPVIAEADYVRPAVASDVGKNAGVAVDAPATSLISEIRKRRHGRVIEGAVSSTERHIDSGIPEPNDVRASIAGDIGKRAGMAVDAPATRLVAE